MTDVRSKGRVVAVVAAVAALQLGGPAEADPVGTNTSHTGPEPDANPFTYCFYSSFSQSGWRDYADALMDGVDATTHMNEDYDCSVGGIGSFTDARLTYTDLPPGTRGRSSCTVLFANGVCDSNLLTIDFDEIWAQSNSDLPYTINWQKTVCHEFGHAMGLTHYKTGPYPDPPDGDHDCMISGAVPNSTAFAKYSAHHKNHINQMF